MISGQLGKSKMAAMQQRKLQEGLELMQQAEKCIKTSWLKWKPDWDNAADKYMKAGTCFKTAKSYHNADKAFRKAADAHYNASALINDLDNCSLFHAGKALEQAAVVLKEMKNTKEAVILIERAGDLYRQSGTPDTAALALIRGAKMCDTSEPAKAIGLYTTATELNEAEDKIREAIDPLVQAAKLQVRLKRFQDAIQTLNHQQRLYEQVENFAMMYKVILSLVVVHLNESDYVAADGCYKNGFEIPGFGSSDEAVAAEKLLDCFDKGDAEGMRACTSQPLFTYLDNELAKLARGLRVPGGDSNREDRNRESSERTATENLPALSGPQTGSTVNQVSGQFTEEAGGEQPVQEQDDFESGGLC